MSKHETPMTEGFWQSVANGAFIPEYPMIAVPSSNASQRWADGVILPDEPHGRARYTDYSDLKGRRVIVVQTKRSRMGMYLMGQAVFSTELIRARGAATVRSIVLCLKTDSALMPLLAPYPEVEVWLSKPDDPTIVTRVRYPE